MISNDRTTSIEPVTVPIATEQFETLVDAGAFDQTLG